MFDAAIFNLASVAYFGLRYKVVFTTLIDMPNPKLAKIDSNKVTATNYTAPCILIIHTPVRSFKLSKLGTSVASVVGFTYKVKEL